MTAIDILLIILIVSASVLCIYLIFWLKKLNTTVNKMQDDIHNLVDNTVPILEDLKNVTDRVNKISTDAENHWNDFDRSIQKIKNKISQFSSIKKNGKPENPASDLVANLRAISKGISEFWSRMKT
jgi:uncharacterized protein YoxC